MKILLISYFFPPGSSVGGLRASSLCQTLPDEGVEVVLLTSQKSINNTEELKKKNRLKEIFYAKESNFRKIGYKLKILALLEMLKLDKLLFFPDLYFSWIKRATRQGEIAINQTNPDAILVTAPPYSSFIVAYNLAKKFDIPLILDYRDPWGGNPFLKHPFFFVQKRTKKVEKKIVDQAGMIVTVGEDYARIITQENNLDSSKFRIIYNGYFKATSKGIFEKNKVCFTVSFFGNFYLIQKDVFAEFLVGLGEMIRRNKLKESEIVFQYAGNTSRKVLERMLKKSGISTYFKDLGFLSPEKLNEEIHRSNLVFDVVPQGTEYMIHTKIYDYFKGSSHILIVGEEGAIIKICKDIDQVYTLVESNYKKIATTIEKLYKKWKKGELTYGCSSEKLVKYERENQAKHYAKVIKEFLQ